MPRRAVLLFVGLLVSFSVPVYAQSPWDDCQFACDQQQDQCNGGCNKSYNSCKGAADHQYNSCWSDAVWRLNNCPWWNIDADMCIMVFNWDIENCNAVYNFAMQSCLSSREVCWSGCNQSREVCGQNCPPPLLVRMDGTPLSDGPCPPARSRPLFGPSLQTASLRFTF
jgi:hypothetical protein